MPHLRTTPGRNVGSTASDTSPTSPRLARARSCGLAKFCHKTGVFRVEVASVGLRGTRRCVRVRFYRAVSRHMSRTSANTTDDVSCKVFLFWAIIFPMTNSPTVLADLVFIVTKCTIQCSKFTKLVTFVVVLPFWGRCRLRKSQGQTKILT